MQTVCFTHCLPQTLLGMLGCQEVTVVINIISVCSCFFFTICNMSRLFSKRGSGKARICHTGCCDTTFKGNLEVGFSWQKQSQAQRQWLRLRVRTGYKQIEKHYTVTLTSIEQDVVIHYSRGTWIKTNRQCLLSMVQNRDKDKHMDRRELLPVIKWWNNIQLHRIARRIT